MSVCVCVCVEMTYCSESDSIIQICGKLDKSNTLLQFRRVIFRSFYSFKLLQTETVFLRFLNKKQTRITFSV